MKIAINECWGGFGVSKAVFEELGIKYDGYGYLDNKGMGIEDAEYNAYRTDPRLIAAIEKVGVEKASGNLAKVRIVKVPDDVSWYIDDYDGMETVRENHRSW